MKKEIKRIAILLIVGLIFSSSLGIAMAESRPIEVPRGEDVSQSAQIGRAHV